MSLLVSQIFTATYLRPPINSPNRYIFNWFHWFAGNLSYILSGLINLRLKCLALDSHEFRTLSITYNNEYNLHLQLLRSIVHLITE